MSSALINRFEKHPALSSVLIAVVGSFAGYIICYLLGLLAIAILVDSDAQSEAASYILAVRDSAFIFASLFCGWPIFFIVGLFVGWPLYSLRAHNAWQAKIMYIWDLCISAALGFLVCGPWNAFVWFATMAYGD